jgi:hypothetical protein
MIDNHKFPYTMLALQAARLPAKANAEPTTAIIQLDAKRTLDLLAAMKTITALAEHSSSLFKISSFEANVLYVPPNDLAFRPAPSNFLILLQRFKSYDPLPVEYVHADIFPWSVCWNASDQADNFSLSTTEVYPPLLNLIASGTLLEPGTSKENLIPFQHRSTFFFNLSKYRNPLH